MDTYLGKEFNNGSRRGIGLGHVDNFVEDGLVNFDASEEHGLIEELVMVVEQHGRIVHRGEAKGRNLHEIN